MEFKRLKLDEIVPYENNPRINDWAIEPVKDSIKQCGYVSPIVVDENNIVLAGHTRLQALTEMEYDDVECIVVYGLTEKQKRKFRILDNKTNEAAEWDTDKLLEELKGLDLGNIHWFDEITNPSIEMIEPKEQKTEPVDTEGDEIICPRCGTPIKTLETIETEDIGESEINWSSESEEA